MLKKLWNKIRQWFAERKLVIVQYAGIGIICAITSLLSYSLALLFVNTFGVGTGIILFWILVAPILWSACYRALLGWIEGTSSVMYEEVIIFRPDRFQHQFS